MSGCPCQKCTCGRVPDGWGGNFNSYADFPWPAWNTYYLPYTMNELVRCTPPGYAAPIIFNNTTCSLGDPINNPQQVANEQMRIQYQMGCCDGLKPVPSDACFVNADATTAVRKYTCQ